MANNEPADSAPFPVRKNPRRAGYDYSSPGAYFVTICTADRRCTLGTVTGDTVMASPVGRVVQSVWDRISADHPGVVTDAFVVMPNHVHGIIVLTQTGGMDPGGMDPGAMNRAPTVPGGMNRAPTVPGGMDPGGMDPGAMNRAPTVPGGMDRAPVPGGMNPGAMNRAPTVPGGMDPGAMNRAPTLGNIVRAFKARVSRHAAADRLVGGDVWQRGYHDRIIRDDAAFDAIRQYIHDNPMKWWMDPHNPERRGAIHRARP